MVLGKGSGGDFYLTQAARALVVSALEGRTLYADAPFEMLRTERARFILGQ